MENNNNRLVLNVEEVAHLLGVSTRHVWVLNSSARLPRPIRFGRAVRWNAAELRDWVNAGAPQRDSWEAKKQRVQSVMEDSADDAAQDKANLLID